MCSTRADYHSMRSMRSMRRSMRWGFIFMRCVTGEIIGFNQRLFKSLVCSHQWCCSFNKLSKISSQPLSPGIQSSVSQIIEWITDQWSRAAQPTVTTWPRLDPLMTTMIPVTLRWQLFLEPLSQHWHRRGSLYIYSDRDRDRNRESTSRLALDRRTCLLTKVRRLALPAGVWHRSARLCVLCVLCVVDSFSAIGGPR
jgi:hypothetical protein